MKIKKKTMWIFYSLVIGISILALILVASGFRTPHVTASADGLVISNSLFGRTVHLNDMKLAEARVINFSDSPELKPKIRTFGISLPGHHTGWYKLKNGEKALLFLTGKKNIVYLPTQEGFSVLVSSDEPNAVITSLRN